MNVVCAAIVGAAILHATAAVATASTDENEIVVSGPGFYPITELQAEGRAAPSGGPDPTFRYTLPDGLTPGHPFWVTARLRLRAQADQKAHGAWVVEATVGGLSAAYIKLAVQGGQIRVDALGMVSGQQHTVGEGQTQLVYENYIRDQATRSGPGSLSVSLRATDPTSSGLAVSVLDGSGLNAVTSPYDELALGVPARPVRAHYGDTIAVPYVVERRGGWPDGPATVVLRAGPGLAVVGPDHRDCPTVGSGCAGTFHLRATAVGVHGMQVAVFDRYNQPARLVAAVVEARSHRVARVVAPWLVSMALVAAIAVVIDVVVRVLHRKRRKDSNGGRH
jgi:hypothetical protein